MAKRKEIEFNHGLGDCVHLARLLQIYREEGWEFTVYGDSNKKWIWQAAGVQYGGGSGGEGFGWGYPGNFEDVGADDCCANKVGHNINHPPLPTIEGSRQEMWERVCDAQVDATEHIRDLCRDEAKTFLRGLPKPIVAIHSRGTSWTERKDIPDVVAFELIRSMLARGWGVVVLDWDARAPMVSHKNCRSIIPTWCMIDPERECALFEQIDLLIGIDSGPFHMASFGDVKTLGIFRDIQPWRCSIPNRHAVNLCRNDHGKEMLDRSDWFNFWQYSGELTHQHIIQAAEAMLQADSYSLEFILDSHEELCGDYLYWRVGHDARKMTLANEYAISHGGGKAEREWKAYKVGGKVHLIITGEHGMICDLTLEEDGVYRGRWSQFECMPIELVPAKVVCGSEGQAMQQADIERYQTGRKTK